jgi:hypothetical protein
MEPDNLSRSGQFDEARDQLLYNLHESLEYNNPYMEYIFLLKTADREFEAGNWAATEILVRRILEMRRQTQSGPWMRAHPTQIKFDHARYGAAMVKAGDLDTALLCFFTSEYDQYEDYAPTISKRILALRNMDDFINIALYVGRSSLIAMMLLPQTTQSARRRPLEATQYMDLDTAFRGLLLRTASSKWDLSGTIRQELSRDLHPSVIVTNEGMSNKNDHLTFQELRQINDKNRVTQLLGCRERKGLVLLNRHVKFVTANGPNLPQNMDLHALEYYLPSQQDSFDRMPGYLYWWRPELCPT